MCQRVVDSGHSIKFNNEYYRFINKTGGSIYIRQKIYNSCDFLYTNNTYNKIEKDLICDMNNNKTI